MALSTETKGEICGECVKVATVSRGQDQLPAVGGKRACQRSPHAGTCADNHRCFPLVRHRVAFLMLSQTAGSDRRLSTAGESDQTQGRYAPGKNLAGGCLWKCLRYRPRARSI